MTARRRLWIIALLSLLLSGATLAQDQGYDPDLAPDADQPPATQPGEPAQDDATSRGAGGNASEGVDMPAPSISAEEVEAAIKLKVDYFYNTMNDQGHWENWPTREAAIQAAGDRASTADRDFGGRSALVVLALLYAGEDYKADKLRKALTFLAETELKGTYVSGIRASMWSKINNPRFRELLKVDAQFLMDAATRRDGTINGFFSYGRPGGAGGDHSNTQYGVLGLRDASIRGIEIPMAYWQAIEKHMIDLQFPDGGWAYRTQKGDVSRQPYGNMTVACLANLYITHDRLQALYQTPCYKGKGIRVHREPEAIDKGKAWLDKQVPAAFGLAPGQRGVGLYYLYGLERCASASGRKTFGGVNWFEEGAKWIIRTQAPDGSHNQYGVQCGTSWALLFLSKGTGAILFNKLDTGADWNTYPMDIPNLSKWCGDELEQRINWQVVDVDEDIRTWLDAPILYFNGQKCPAFTDDEKRKLRLYTDSGGTLVAEALCSNVAFTRSFKELAKEVWPEWELQRLDRRHPVLTSHYTIRGTPRNILHMHDGCRSRVFLITEDMACAWHQRLLLKYKHFFEFGMNLARYASDQRLLRSRLFFQKWEIDELRAKGKPVPEVSLERGKVTLVDWATDGARRTDIRAMRHLRETLHEASNVALRTVPVANHDLGDLGAARIVHMSGHNTFSASEENLDKLRAFVKGGGLIWADAQCGREAFNESFPKFLARLLPGAQLRDVAQSDPVITGKGLARDGFDMIRVRYKRALRFNLFQAVLKEVRLDGRRVVLYSPHDLTCGLDGHWCWQCRGPERNDCLKLAANIVLSALRQGDLDGGPDKPDAVQQSDDQGPTPPWRPGEKFPITE